MHFDRNALRDYLALATITADATLEDLADAIARWLTKNAAAGTFRHDPEDTARIARSLRDHWEVDEHWLAFWLEEYAALSEAEQKQLVAWLKSGAGLPDPSATVATAVFGQSAGASARRAS